MFHITTPYSFLGFPRNPRLKSTLIYMISLGYKIYNDEKMKMDE